MTPTSSLLVAMTETNDKAESRNKPGGKTKKETLKILVVDDDRDFVKGFLALLEEEGFEAEGVFNGKEALEYFREHSFDCIFVDGLLPGMDGFKLCSEIRWIKHGERVPLIMISGVYRASIHGAEAIQKYRLFDYLEKPVSPGDIVQVLRRVFGKDYPKPEIVFDEGENGDTKLRQKRYGRYVNTFYLFDRTKISLVGRLSEAPFPIILNQMYERRLSGMLMLVWGKAKKVITLKEGRPISVNSNIVSECQGQLLDKIGKITREQLDRSLELMKKTGKKQGETLIEMGAITQDKLTEALRLQFEHKLFSVFGWDDASFSFKPLKEVPDPPFEIETHPHRMIRKGIIHHLPPGRIDTWLKPYHSSPVTTENDAKNIMEEAGFTLIETRFSSDFDGSETLSEILQNPLKKPEEMKAFIFTLVCIGAVRVDQPTEYEAPDIRGAVEAEKSKTGALRTQVEQIKSGAADEGKSGEKPSSDEDAEKMELMLAVQHMSPEQKKYYQSLFMKRKKIRDKNYFDVFGIAIDTPPDKIGQLFLEQAKKYHPDAVTYTEVPEIKRMADEIFTIYSMANETLTNKERRTEYIEMIESGGDVDATEEVAKILASEEHFFEGKRAARQKDWAKSKKAFQEAIKLNPNEGEYYAELGWAFFNNRPSDSENRREAARYMEKSIELSPKFADTYYYMASIFKADGKPNKALEWFQKTLEVDPKHPRANSEINLIKMRSKKTGKTGLFSVFKKK